jgi:hypothetical protein
VIIWHIFPILVCFTKKNLATLLQITLGRSWFAQLKQRSSRRDSIPTNKLPITNYKVIDFTAIYSRVYTMRYFPQSPYKKYEDILVPTLTIQQWSFTSTQ